MALIPFWRNFWEDPWEGMRHPSRIYDQHFGNLIPQDLLTHFRYPLSMIQPPHQTGLSEVINNENEFCISLDVQHFKPDEISVKTKDNRLIIRARHEERPDEHGFIMREFIRQYVLPKDVDPAAVTSSLTKDGILTLKARKIALDAPKEVDIPISHEN